MRSLETVKEGLEDKYTVEEINTKIKHIRSYYAKELAKVRKSTKSGAGTDDVYKSKWSHFESLDVFLHCQITPRQSLSNMDSQTEEQDEDQTDDRETVETGDNQNSGTSKLKKQKTGPSAVMAEAVSVLSQLKNNMGQRTPRTDVPNEEDEDSVFRKYLVNELRKIKNPSVKNAVRLKLQTVIFDAQGEHTRLPVQDSGRSTATQRIWRPLSPQTPSLQSGVQRSSSLPSFNDSDSNEVSQPPYNYIYTNL